MTESHIGHHYYTSAENGPPPKYHLGWSCWGICSLENRVKGGWWQFVVLWMKRNQDRSLWCPHAVSDSHILWLVFERVHNPSGSPPVTLFLLSGAQFKIALYYMLPWAITSSGLLLFACDFSRRRFGFACLFSFL